VGPLALEITVNDVKNAATIVEDAIGQKYMCGKERSIFMFESALAVVGK